MTDPTGHAPKSATPAAPAIAPISVRLFESSESFAQSAMKAYNEPNLGVFYLHLGTALELLVKAALAHANPAFIADVSRTFDPMLHLTGMGDRAKTPEFVAAVKTIAISDAWPRIARLIDDYTAHGPLIETLLVRRNAVAHTGITVRGQEADILGEVGRYLPQLLAYVGRTGAAYWGEHEAFVTEHAERRLTEAQAAYGRRLAAAKGRYAELAARLGEALEAAVVGLEPSVPNEDFTEIPYPCPACGRTGTLHGDPEPQWEPEYEQDGPDDYYVSGMTFEGLNLAASAFNCRVCGLALYGEDLRPARLAFVRFDATDPRIAGADDSFDPYEADDEPEDWEP